MESRFFRQLTLEMPQAQAEDCSELLTEWGAVAVTLTNAADNDPDLGHDSENAIFEPALGTTPLWIQTKVIALFEQDFDLEPIKTMLATTLEPSIFNTLTIEIIEDQDWVRASLDQFKPQCFGGRLWVCPSWCEADLKTLSSSTDAGTNNADTDTNSDSDIRASTALATSTKPNPVLMLLDPGLAFGTGSHPTTKLCLEWLAQQDVSDKNVLDYGCGSGILGIAAVKLGAKQLIAVDHDPQALDSTRENADLNHIKPSQMRCVLPKEMPASLTVDILLANILANPLIELAPKLSAMLAPQGQMVLSGILTSQVERVIQAYQPFLQNFLVVEHDGWVSIAATQAIT